MTPQSQIVLHLRLINLEAAKQIYQAKIAVLNVSRHGMQPMLLHLIHTRLEYKLQ